jgi:hypothetical protein
MNCSQANAQASSMMSGDVLTSDLTNVASRGLKRS